MPYRQGLEFLLKHDKSAVIKYTAPGLPGHIITFILPEKDQQRLQFEPMKDISQATYYLSICR